MFLINSVSKDNVDEFEQSGCFKKIIKTIPISLFRIAIPICNRILLPTNTFYSDSQLEKPSIRATITVLFIIIIEAVAFIYRRITQQHKDNKGE